ncbi:MAG: hypothetical protein N2645_06420 [Clostridia bacterium]|nr:hypothetical protein [Clostridia bacterium]
MDITLIIVIAVGAIFVIGGTMAGHYATKASQKDADEKNHSENK